MPQENFSLVHWNTGLENILHHNNVHMASADFKPFCIVTWVYYYIILAELMYTFACLLIVQEHCHLFVLVLLAISLIIKIGKSFKLKNYKYKTVLFRSSCMFKRCRFTHKHYINVLRFINFNPILPFKLIANMNIGLFYNWQNRFVKGALATILTKKIICFGNW